MIVLLLILAALGGWAVGVWTSRQLCRQYIARARAEIERQTTIATLRRVTDALTAENEAA